MHIVKNISVDSGIDHWFDGELSFEHNSGHYSGHYSEPNSVLAYGYGAVLPILLDATSERGASR